MRWKMKFDVWIYFMVLFMVCSCAETVARLDLRDPRLPIEARRWLADTEDEVAIARAMRNDLKSELEQLKDYQEGMIDKIEDAWSGSKGAGSEGKTASESFEAYAKERIVLKKLELDRAGTVLELAKTRLRQARAETAVRYDIAVYDLKPIVEEVGALKNRVADSTKLVEQQRAVVEGLAGKAWQHYYRFASKGGQTNALWTIH